ncbi:MAG: GNAT family N-acetyltransferase [Rhodanobacteraceae bacterium]
MNLPSDPDAAFAPSSDVALLQADAPQHVEIVRALFREYAEAIGTDLEYQGFSAELAALPDPYVPPRGALLIARVGGAVAGCVGLRPIDEGMGEMKRLYVRPAWRKSGLGRHLVQAVIDAARRAAYRELRLDTLPSMAAAQALYCRLGFAEIPPYNDAHLPGTRFYALKLSDDPARTDSMPRP